MLSKLKISYDPEPDSGTRDKVKVVLDFSNYATETELSNATSVDRSNSAATSNVIALKAEVEKLRINKFVNVQTSLNKLKRTLDDSDVNKLETVSVDLKNYFISHEPIQQN